MPEFGMSDSAYFDGRDMVLEHATFPYLTGVGWDVFNRLAAISEEAFVSSLIKSATPDGQRLAIQDSMARELAESNRRISTPSQPSRNDSVKMETYVHSGNSWRVIVADSLVSWRRQCHSLEVSQGSLGEDKLPPFLSLWKIQGVGSRKDRRRRERVSYSRWLLEWPSSWL